LTIVNKGPLSNVFNKALDYPSLQVKAEVPEQQYSFCKRKILIDKEKKLSNLAKAIVIISESFNNNNTKLALLAAKYDLEIPIYRTYKEAVNDANYSQQ